MTHTKGPVLRGWHFDNSYEQLPEALYTRIKPTPVSSPQLVLFNRSLADQMGLDTDALESDEGTSVFSGNVLPEGAQPIAQAYAGHQFAYFTNLGDGRAILLGEHITPAGERFDIQLKGSGPTPYSRNGDGRAALGPMLREYIISEAMHALGIPTTRSLAVISSGDFIRREETLPGAILTRVAASHIRVGTFQYAAAQSIPLLQTLTDYTIQRHFSHLGSPSRYSNAGEDGNLYAAFLHAVIERQAELIAKWQLVGFIHGVMNTDNMALSGETIDYGPCAFMDNYDPRTVFSSIDRNGRYAYGNQPAIAQWNLGRFAETLLPLIHPEQTQALQLAQDAVDSFLPLYSQHWLNGMRRKLGFSGEETGDMELVEELLRMMHHHQLDYTLTFTALTYDEVQNTPAGALPEFQAWIQTWKARRNRCSIGDSPHDHSQCILLSQKMMTTSNPTVIPRNHQVETALDAAVGQGDFTVLEKLMKVLSEPYVRTPENSEYTVPPEATPEHYRTFCGT